MAKVTRLSLSEAENLMTSGEWKLLSPQESERLKNALQPSSGGQSEVPPEPNQLQPGAAEPGAQPPSAEGFRSRALSPEGMPLRPPQGGK